MFPPFLKEKELGILLAFLFLKVISSYYIRSAKIIEVLSRCMKKNEFFGKVPLPLE